MNLLITICARGGSKGIPGKNIRLLNNKPLIAFTIDVAKKLSEIIPSDIVLSTDSDTIKGVSADYGIKTQYTRPAELATDTAGKIAVIKDVLLFEEKNRNKYYDYILDMDITSPLRTVEDLINAFQIIKNDPNCASLFSVNKSHRNPYFNMVEQNDNGYYTTSKTAGENIKTRQSAPKVYDLNASFYFYKRTFFENGFTGAITPFSLIYEMPHLCFDLDEITDFEYLEYLMMNEKLPFLC